MAVSNCLGGTLEFVPGGNAFRHFQTMSNELSTPMILNCPADRRDFATNFVDLGNQNISYFVGVDATATNRQAWLCGDRNITNGFAPNHEMVNLQSGQTIGWTRELHNRCANVALADTSVQEISSSDLRKTLKKSKDWKNRIALPD